MSAAPRPSSADGIAHECPTESSRDNRIHNKVQTNNNNISVSHLVSFALVATKRALNDAFNGIDARRSSDIETPLSSPARRARHRRRRRSHTPRSYIKVQNILQIRLPNLHAIITIIILLLRICDFHSDDVNSFECVASGAVSGAIEIESGQHCDGEKGERKRASEPSIPNTNNPHFP